MSNRCTFINPNSPWISRMKYELQYELSTDKLYDDLRQCPCTSKFMHSSHHSLVTSILLNCHNQISLTTYVPQPFPDYGPFSLTFHCDLSRIPQTFPGFQKFPKSAKLVTPSTDSAPSQLRNCRISQPRLPAMCWKKGKGTRVAIYLSIVALHILQLHKWKEYLT